MSGVQTVNVTTSWEQISMTNASRDASENCLIMSSSDGAGDLISPETELLISKLRSAVFIPLIYAFGGPANLINIIVFLKQGIKDRVHLCLFSLAFVDFCTSSFFFLIYCEHIFMFKSPDTHGPVFAFFANNKIMIFYSSRFGSMFLSTIIALERCFCVLFPLHAKMLLKTKNMAVMILIGVPIVSFLRLVVMAKYEVACVFDRRRQVSFRTLFVTAYQHKYKELLSFIDGIFYGFIISVGCPVVVLIATAITSVKLWQTVVWRQKTFSTKSGKETAVTKMLIVLSGHFLILNLPVLFNRIYPLFNVEFNANGRYKLFFHACATLSEVFTLTSMSYTFVVYYFAGSKYRQTFHDLFKGNFCYRIANTCLKAMKIHQPRK